MAELGLAPMAELELDGALMAGGPGWLVFATPGIGVQGMAGDAVEDSEELRVDWSQTNSAVELEWYSTTAVWVSRTSLDGAASRVLRSGGAATFASARDITLEPDTGGMLFLTRLSYCLSGP